MSSDIYRVDRTTYEPAEHSFGIIWKIIRECIVSQMANEQEIQCKRMKLMFKHKFRRRREGCKWYEDTFDDRMVRSTCKEIKRGPCEVDLESHVPVSNQLFKHSIKMFSEAETIMSPILNMFDIAPDRMSPFCETCLLLQDLLDDHINFTKHSSEE